MSLVGERNDLSARGAGGGERGTLGATPEGSRFWNDVTTDVSVRRGSGGGITGSLFAGGAVTLVPDPKVSLFPCLGLLQLRPFVLKLLQQLFLLGNLQR
jgi:hypothetical protein